MNKEKTEEKPRLFTRIDEREVIKGFREHIIRLREEMYIADSSEMPPAAQSTDANS